MFIPGSLSETLSSLRECLNSNQSWNFVQAQFFHTLQPTPGPIRDFPLPNFAKGFNRLHAQSWELHDQRALQERRAAYVDVVFQGGQCWIITFAQLRSARRVSDEHASD
jgi:hypothetical protein